MVERTVRNTPAGNYRRLQVPEKSPYLGGEAQGEGKRLSASQVGTPDVTRDVGQQQERSGRANYKESCWPKASVPRAAVQANG